MLVHSSEAEKQLSTGQNQMAPSPCMLAVSALTLLLPQAGVAFVQPRTALMRGRASTSIMSKSMIMSQSPDGDSAVRRGTFVSQLVGGIGIGVVGLGFGSERTAAYEVSSDCRPWYMLHSSRERSCLRCVLSSCSNAIVCMKDEIPCQSIPSTHTPLLPMLWQLTGLR